MKPKGFRTEASGTIWSKAYRSPASATKALERLERKGYRGAVNNLGGRWVVRLRADSFMDNSGRRRKRNPTKAQKRAKARTAAKKRGLVQAVHALVKKLNPTAAISGARVVKLKGGGLTIRPIKSARRRR